MAVRYQQRRDLALSVLKLHPEVGIDIVEPQGTFYLFLDVRKLGMRSDVVSARLLDEALVAIVPGSVYGGCGEGFLRMTIAVAERDIEAGLNRLQEWAAQVSHKRLPS
jgi:aspartate/methionine/tyrosine aminotransferase